MKTFQDFSSYNGLHWVIDTRRIRVLSSETIGHFKNKLKLQAAFIGVQAVQTFKALKHKSIKRHSVLFSIHLSTDIIDGKHHLQPI